MRREFKKDNPDVRNTRLSQRCLFDIRLVSHVVKARHTRGIKRSPKYGAARITTFRFVLSTKTNPAECVPSKAPVGLM